MRTIGSPAVITIVCSAWAESAPSLVRIVQPSPASRTAPEPAAMIGSIVSTSPSVSGSESQGT